MLELENWELEEMKRNGKCRGSGCESVWNGRRKPCLKRQLLVHPCRSRDVISVVECNPSSTTRHTGRLVSHRERRWAECLVTRGMACVFSSHRARLHLV
jgi:hypothetical protein